jgi:hypothetical protein
MDKRQPQIILKTDDGKVVLELCLEGKFAAKSTGGDQIRVFLEGDKPRDRGQRPPLGADAPTRQTPYAKAGAALLPGRLSDTVTEGDRVLSAQRLSKPGRPATRVIVRVIGKLERSQIAC